MQKHLTELTFRGILLGGIITVLFTAANVYLGLKSGLTFATSLPAAVISMALLRLLPNSSILENNIVQTVASAAGTLSAIIFVLPGLVMLGYWQGFPFWTSTFVCLSGGVLGVMFSVPLRRALVTGTSMPYPEGAAAAEVLIVGSAAGAGAAENKQGLRLMLVSSLVAAGYALLAAMKLVAAEAAKFFRVGSSISGVSGGLSFALFGVGHLVGLSAGIAMLLGLVLAWGVLMPYFSFGLEGEVDALASSLFRNKVRFLGSGMIGVAAIWTLLKIIGPISSGIRASLASNAQRAKGETLALAERDIPFHWVIAITLATLVPIAWLLWAFVSGGPLADSALLLISVTLLFVLVAGLIIASVCGYMAGLVGSSNSPISSVGILSAVSISVLLVLVMGRSDNAEQTSALIAYALFATAIVFGVATISNDNLQDLKTGQLVGATPWRQQVALLIGVVFGSLVIPPVLGLLNTAFGFAGSPGAGDNALSAPQATLITALAKGVLGGDLDWSLLGTGALLGVLLIALDEMLGKAGKLRIPPLAVGMGLYLPMALTTPMVLGALIGHRYDQWARQQRDSAKAIRMGTLMATGMIVGESLFGVVFAGIVAISGSDNPLALVGSDMALIAEIAGLAAFTAAVWWLYQRARQASA